MRTSIGSSATSSSFVMSPTLGTCGKRWASTAHGNGAISENHCGVHPSGSQAIEGASMPEHTVPYIIVVHGGGVR